MISGQGTAVATDGETSRTIGLYRYGGSNFSIRVIREPCGLELMKETNRYGRVSKVSSKVMARERADIAATLNNGGNQSFNFGF